MPSHYLRQCILYEKNEVMVSETSYNKIAMRLQGKMNKTLPTALRGLATSPNLNSVLDTSSYLITSDRLARHSNSPKAPTIMHPNDIAMISSDRVITRYVVGILRINGKKLEVVTKRNSLPNFRSIDKQAMGNI